MKPNRSDGFTSFADRSSSTSDQEALTTASSDDCYNEKARREGTLGGRGGSRACQGSGRVSHDPGDDVSPTHEKYATDATLLGTKMYGVSDDCARGVDVSRRRAQAWSNHDGSSDRGAGGSPGRAQA